MALIATFTFTIHAPDEASDSAVAAAMEMLPSVEQFAEALEPHIPTHRQLTLVVMDEIGDTAKLEIDR